MKSRNSKFAKVILMVVLGIFITIQFIRPEIVIQAVTHPIKAPAEVVAILQRACYDCHSNETKLSWYDHIAPASWLVAADVREARSRFNFSTWDTMSAADQQGRVWEAVNMILAKKMPLPTYLTLHSGARLSDHDIQVLKEYANAGTPPKYHDSSLIAQAEKEWGIVRGRAALSVAQFSAANGVRYIQGFTDWQVIGTTNRFDNHSIRVLYGNDIAARAIREGHTDPLPEGSTIVKMVWNSIEEKDGTIYPGTLNSVQIMTRDERRFPDSKGWGFAKFNGIGLKPYGHDAAFNTTCFNCHKIADKNDYVFNLPVEPALYDAGGLKVITVFADRARKTMSVLYGDAAARRSAAAGFKDHTADEHYRLVSYAQTDNRFWYGSYINGKLLSAESFTGDDPGRFAELLRHPPAVFP